MITEQVIKIVAESKGIPSDGVTEDSTFEELGIDSLDSVDIVCALENHYNVNISTAQVREMRSIRHIVDGLRPLVEPAPHAIDPLRA